MKIFLIFTFVLFFAVCANAQAPGCPPMPPGFFCLNQDQANTAAENTRLRPVYEKKIADLEDGLKKKDETIAENKVVALKNEGDLREKNVELLVKLGTATGQLIGAEASVVRLTGEVEFLNKNGRKKCGTFSICIQ